MGRGRLYPSLRPGDVFGNVVVVRVFRQTCQANELAELRCTVCGSVGGRYRDDRLRANPPKCVPAGACLRELADSRQRARELVVAQRRDAARQRRQQWLAQFAPGIRFGARVVLAFLGVRPGDKNSRVRVWCEVCWQIDDVYQGLLRQQTGRGCVHARS